MVSKVMAGALAFCVIGMAVLGWLLKGQVAEAAKWEQAHVSLQTENQEFQNQLEEYRGQLDQERKISTERELKRSALKEQNRNLKQRIQELSYEQPEIQDYLDLVIPADLLSGLQQFAATDGSTEDREGLAPKPLVAPLPPASNSGE